MTRKPITPEARAALITRRLLGMKGWTLHRCDNGTYDALGPHATDGFGYDYQNLGNGKDEASAWADLRLLLQEQHPYGS